MSVADDHKNVSVTPPQETPKTQDIEVAANPNPRANENLDAAPGSTGEASGVGSEITDGEDA
jgi:hypothetical protein